MQNFKQEVKDWLKKIGKDREWLGQQCAGTSKRTIDNWLAPNGEIPKNTVPFIKKLMSESERHNEGDLTLSQLAQGIIPAKLIIDMTPDNFRRLEKIALEEGITLTDAAAKVMENYVREKWAQRNGDSSFKAAEDPAPYGSDKKDDEQD